MVYTEKDVMINGEFVLTGTMGIPMEDEGNELGFPSILILPGSGPGDRDGNLSGVQLNIYKQLSDFLVGLGFVTLRFDKRGVGGSEGDFAKAGFWDIVNDAENALHFLKQCPQVNPNKVIVLGHSEGCIVSVALNTKQPLDGMILLGGAGGTLEEALAYQRECVYKELYASRGFKGLMARIFNVRKKGEKEAEKFKEKIKRSNDRTIFFKGVEHNAQWFREHFTYQLMHDYQTISCPVLAVTGSKDVQANPNDVRKVKDLVNAKAVVEDHIVKNMNHLLKYQESDVTMTKLMDIYQHSVGEPLANELENIIAKWLHSFFDND